MDLGFHENFTDMIRDKKKKNEHTESIASPTDPTNSNSFTRIWENIAKKSPISSVGSGELLLYPGVGVYKTRNLCYNVWTS